LQYTHLHTGRRRDSRSVTVTTTVTTTTTTAVDAGDAGDAGAHKRTRITVLGNAIVLLFVYGNRGEVGVSKGI
jgi:uncharacterized membrane protein YdfJ with MMPL/SSD domain